MIDQNQLERMMREELDRFQRDIRNEFAVYYGGMINAHEKSLNGDGKNIPGVIREVETLRDEVREIKGSVNDQFRNTRWIFVILGFIFIGVSITVYMLFQLWIQVSVLAVRIP